MLVVAAGIGDLAERVIPEIFESVKKYWKKK